VEGLLAGEDLGKDGRVFDTGKGWALNEVAPDRPLRLWISKGADKGSNLSMLDKLRAEVGDAGSTHSLERVMNLGENRIGMRIPRSAWFLRDLRFPHS
jgi:hypothetical protein